MAISEQIIEELDTVARDQVQRALMTLASSGVLTKSCVAAHMSLSAGDPDEAMEDVVSRIRETRQVVSLLQRLQYLGETYIKQKEIENEDQ